LSPPVLLTLIWAGIFCLRSLPLMQMPPLSAATQVLLLGCYAIFIASYAVFHLPLVGRNTPRPHSTTTSSLQRIVGTAIWFAAIGLAGALARAFDIYLSRGLDFSEGIAAARLANIAMVSDSGAGQSAMSGIGRLLMGFSSVAAMITVLRYEDFPAHKARLLLVSFAIVLGLSALEGGRNTIAVNCLFLISCLIIRRHKGLEAIPGGAKVRRKIYMLFVSILVFFSYVFIERFDALGHGIVYAFDALESAFDVEFSPALKGSTNNALLTVSVSLAGLSLYATHALNELNWVLEWSRDAELAHGAYNFDLVALLLQRVGLDGLRFDYNTLFRPGVYVTAVGELVIDFGAGGTIGCCAVAGAFFGRAWNDARRKSSCRNDLSLGFGLAFLMASPLYSIAPGFLNVIGALLLFAYWVDRKQRTLVRRRRDFAK